MEVWMALKHHFKINVSISEIGVWFFVKIHVPTKNIGEYCPRRIVQLQYCRKNWRELASQYQRDQNKIKTVQLA